MAPPLIFSSVLCLILFGYWYRDFPPMTQFQRHRVFFAACVCGVLAGVFLTMALTSTSPHVWWGNGCMRKAHAYGLC